MNALRTVNMEPLALPRVSKVKTIEPAAPRTAQRGAVEIWRRALTVIFGVIMAGALLTIGSQWENHTVVQEVLFLTGICLAAVGTLGRTWSNLFISGYKTKVLIRTGPYSLCRNPLYLFSAIGMIGIGLCSETLTVPLIMVLFFAAYYPLVIHSEEQRLAATHPECFADYRASVPAFWPQLQNYQEPETYTMVPRLMRKGMMDAFWFVALAAMTQVVADLHVADLLPDLYRLW